MVHYTQQAEIMVSLQEPQLLQIQEMALQLAEQAALA
jgi:hypothetical protein